MSGFLINQATQYNNQFLAPNSARPICGHVVYGMYKNGLIQAVNRVKQDSLPFATGVTLQTRAATNGSSAGVGLNPNVLVIEKVATGAADLSGFVISSPTDFLFPGDEVATARTNQIVYVAVFGSQVEMFVPCDTSLASVEIDGVNANYVDYDFIEGRLKKGTTFRVTLLSNVVDGVKPQVDTQTSTIKLVPTKCIKVRL